MTRWKYGLASIVFALTIFLVGGLFLNSTPNSFVQAQGGVTGFTNVRISQQLRLAPQQAISVTMNGDINPTGSYQQLDSAGAVSVSGADITVEPAGTLLTLHNVSANTITITETGTLISAGNVALGANDSATFVSDGTNWRQIAASNN